MFLKPSIVLEIQQELFEFSKLCNKFNYKPTKEEIKEILDYLLIIQNNSTSGAMTESLESLLYETVELNLITERGGGDGEFGFLIDGGSSLIKVVSNATGGSFKYISFLFKKGKIKGIVKAIDAINNKKIDLFSKLTELETKRAKLTDEEPSGFKNYIPTYEGA